MNGIERRYYRALDHVQEPHHRLRGLSMLGIGIIFALGAWRFTWWMIVATFKVLVRVTPTLARVGLSATSWTFIFALKMVVWVIPRLARLTVVVGLGALYFFLATCLGAAGGLKTGRR